MRKVVIISIVIIILCLICFVVARNYNTYPGVALGFDDVSRCIPVSGSTIVPNCSGNWIFESCSDPDVNGCIKCRRICWGYLEYRDFLEYE